MKTTTEIKLSQMKDFKTLITSFELNKTYLFPDKFRYEWVQIEKDKDGFSWTMKYNYKYAGTSGYIFPMKNGSLIKTFKSEKGAKDNFIKQFSEYFLSNLK